jgi:nicotinamide-nucleotide amidase
VDTELENLSVIVGDALRARGWTLATAESCTGGWVAQVVTATAGSSAWFDCGVVTYSNEAKEALLGVSDAVLLRNGAVSEATVAAMVSGTLARSQANLVVESDAARTPVSAGRGN